LEFKLVYLACILAGYLIGNLQTAVFLSKYRYHDDVRQHGSGNAGTTNMLRVFGMKPGVFTFLGDFAKGILAVLIGRLLAGETGAYITGFFAVIGHNFPAIFGFKGGKGVATTMGIAWMIDPLFGAIATVIGAMFIYFSQMVSLGSLIGFTSFVVLVAIFRTDETLKIILAAALFAMMVIRHIENISRLMKGTESKLFQAKKSKSSKQDI
jgi:glycerol-3-phosphate acyltransferase PlsY